MASISSRPKRKRAHSKREILGPIGRRSNSTRHSAAKPPRPAAAQRLPNDVLWYLARTFLWRPGDVYELARASRGLWVVLEKEIYITDVAAVRSRHARALDPVRTTLLHWAAVAGRAATLDKALAAARLVWPPYVDYQHARCGHAASHFAAHYGRLGAVQRLAGLGTAVCDVAAPSGWVCPAPQRLASILERLLPGRFRVPPDCLVHSREFPFRIDALGLAILKGHEAVAWYLMRHYEERRAVEEKIISPLHLAAFVGMPKIVEAILAKGTDVNFRCRHVEDSTPLQWAVAGASGLGRKETVLLLMQHGADRNIVDRRGHTALDWAIGFKVPENVYLLLTESAEIPPRHSWSPSLVETWTKRLQKCMADDCFLDCTKFIIQRCQGLPETCLKLCAHSTFWDIDRSWDEPGSVSTATKNMETKRWLVEEGIGLGVLSRGARESWMQEELFTGRAFLHYAAGSSDMGPELLRQIMEQRPQDVNVLDAKGLTPLELALGYRCQPLKAQALVEHGANQKLCFGGDRARADIDQQIRGFVDEED
ncbi:uncharacterized protein JN550_007294 [Neoarthrinium moseri]|uniref:uncharacterized protein n=1 Tax=Neoarthrinium moseri TaxID=1658444 RepID=UPI001FDB7870|nr:uncharacterized protein JN550_007294 [Neoarthrinium moseri]KAI1867242.1 hypothetical protein JN550_007294 [Neoarthrinium moseri]